MTEDSLSPAAITRNLETRFVGQRVIYLPRVGSTMEMARREAQQGAAEGTAVIAGEQTGGRGRAGRRWLSPRGTISLSIVLYPALAYLPSLIMLASLAVVYSIGAVTGLGAGIKWPNDVLVGGRKVCGVLIESGVRRGRVDYAIIGIGMNVNLELSRFPEIAPTATSLSGELGRAVSRRKLLRSLLVEAEGLYLALQAGGSIYEAWRDSLVMLGKPVQVTEENTVHEGIAESVGRDGSLFLRQRDGGLLRVVAGDVSLRY